MPKRCLAEIVLALFAGRERAAAIYGDLTEMATTRGGAWFWTAYTRALVTFGWRSPVALACALVGMRFALRIVLRLADLMPYHLSDPGLFGEENVRLSFILWNIPLAITQCLAFAVPFALIRFGRRDDLTRLCGLLLLATIPVYAPIAWVRDMSGLCTIFAFAAALASPLWRRSALVLAATCLTAIVTIFASAHTMVGIFHMNFFAISPNTRFMGDVLGVALAVIVCVGLHRRLLQQPQLSGDTHVEPS